VRLSSRYLSFRIHSFDFQIRTHPIACMSAHRADRPIDWAREVFRGAILPGVEACFSFQEANLFRVSCKSFEQRFADIRADPAYLWQWFKANQHLNGMLDLEPPIYKRDGRDANKKYYVGDLVHLGVYLQCSYNELRLQDIVNMQERFPWFDEQAADRVCGDWSANGDGETRAVELLKLLRGSDLENLRLWRCTGLPCPQLWACVDDHGHISLTEKGQFGSCEIHLDGQGDVEIPHTLVGDKTKCTSYGEIDFDCDGEERSGRIIPILSFTCSRARLLERVAPPEAMNLQPEQPPEPETGLWARVPASEDFSTRLSDGNKTVELDGGAVCVVDMTMKPGTGKYSVAFKFVNIQTATAAVGVLAEPAVAPKRRYPGPFENWPADMIDAHGKLPGSSIHEITAWSQYGGLNGTRQEHLGCFLRLGDCNVRGFSEYSAAGEAETLGLIYDSDAGWLGFVVDDEVQEQRLPVQGVGQLRFCALGGGSGDRISILRVAKENMWL